MTPFQLKRLKALMKQATVLKKKIAKDRDKLWGVISDLTEIHDDLVEGDEDFDNGLRSIGDAADRMSRYI